MFLTWLVRFVAVFVVGVLCLVTWIYVASELHLQSFELPPAFDQPIPSDSAAIARGEHLARTRGCRGCHSEDLSGRVMWKFAVAPNLTTYARTESTATFETALRHGIGRDGRALYSMPSYNFFRMRDADVVDLIAYLRTVPVMNKELPSPSLPWQVRMDMALGKDAAIPAYLHLVPPLKREEDPDPQIARGEYIAMTTCNECHGFGLRADTPWEDNTAPDLVIIRAYDQVAFSRLMLKGIALGERELRMMSPVARSRFAYFTEQEVSDVYTFLTHMSMHAERNN